MKPETQNPHGGTQALKLEIVSDPILHAAYPTNFTSDIISAVAVQQIEGPVSNPQSVELSCWYKYSSVGGDSAVITIVIYDTLQAGYSDEKPLYSDEIIIKNITSTWSNAILTMNPELTGSANLIEISVYSSMYTSHIGTTLWIDDFVLENNFGAGLHEKENSLISAIYPIPVIDVLNFQLKDETSLIEILSNDGKVIITKSINNKTTSIDISNLSSGIYFYKVSNSKGEIEINKFIKE